LQIASGISQFAYFAIASSPPPLAASPRGLAPYRDDEDVLTAFAFDSGRYPFIGAVSPATARSVSHPPPG